jgi:hypothetical protein
MVIKKILIKSYRHSINVFYFFPFIQTIELVHKRLSLQNDINGVNGLRHQQNDTQINLNPVDPGCHLVDDIQNAKEIFCVLSFKFNMFITRDSLHNSRFLSFLCTVIMKLNSKPADFEDRTQQREISYFFFVSCRTQEIVGIERVNQSIVFKTASIV